MERKHREEVQQLQQIIAYLRQQLDESNRMSNDLLGLEQPLPLMNQLPQQTGGFGMFGQPVFEQTYAQTAPLLPSQGPGNLMGMNAVGPSQRSTNSQGYNSVPQTFQAGPSGYQPVTRGGGSFNTGSITGMRPMKTPTYPQGNQQRSQGLPQNQRPGPWTTNTNSAQASYRGHTPSHVRKGDQRSGSIYR